MRVTNLIFLIGLSISSFQELVDAYPSFATKGLGTYVEGSLALGADTIANPGDSFFGFTTLLLEAAEPSIRFADNSLTSWLIGSNGAVVEGFQIQDLCAQSLPFLIEPSDGSQGVFVSSDSLLNAAGIELQNTLQISAFAENGEQGALGYWNGSTWVSTSAGTNGQSLTICNGIPTWGPCPSAAAELATLRTSQATHAESSSTVECSLTIGFADVNLLTDQGFFVHDDLNMLQDPGSKNSAVYAGDGTFTLSKDASSYLGEVYVLAYAENAAGIAVGDTLKVWVESSGFLTCGEVYTYQGEAYPTVEINSECWFASNLRSSYDSNGMGLDTATTDADVAASLAVLAIDFDAASYYADYGWMYNYKAMEADKNGEMSLCPTGWGLPTSDQWHQLDTNYTSGNHFLDLATLQSQSNLPTFSSNVCPDCNNNSGFNANHGQYYSGNFPGDSFQYSIGFWSQGFLPSTAFSFASYPQVSLRLPMDVVMFKLTPSAPQYTHIIQSQTAAYIRCVQQ